MSVQDPPSVFSVANRRRAVIIAMGATLVIAFFDVVVVSDVSLGFLYLYPLILAAGYHSRWKALPLAALYAVLARAAYPTAAGGLVNATTVVTVASFVAAGLFAAQMGLNRRRLESQMRAIDDESRRRKEAEEEFRVLIETSAAAIVTVNAEGRILQSNQSAERILGCESRALRGQSIQVYLPFMEHILVRQIRSRTMRTMVEGRGHRGDGTAFFAQVWFSTYRTSFGPRLALILWDASEQVREREELGLRQLMTSSRIFVGAVSHEVRNLCAAISVNYVNLQSKPELADDPDLQALGTLVEGLRQLTSSDLRSASPSDLLETDLAELLEEVSIIASPSVADAGAKVTWEVTPGLPKVRADRPALLQVLLNLLNNGLRAVEEEGDKTIQVVAYSLREAVVIRICNRGPAMRAPQDLFQPFQSGASSSGLGLYVSRAIVRTFGGDLTYLPENERHCFLIQLTLAQEDETYDEEN